MDDLKKLPEELTLDVVQTQLSSKTRKYVTQETIDTVKRIAEDPDYGEEFLETYLNNLNTFKNNVRGSHIQYINAVKFYTLVESGDNLTDAYIKVFPERYNDRCKGLPESERTKNLVTSEASRFNKSVMVNEIRQLNAIPSYLIHRNLFLEALTVQADLMRGAKSEFVRQKASQVLIEKLDQPDRSDLVITVDDKATSVIDELRRVTEQLAATERSSIIEGRATVKDISERKLVTDYVENDR